MSSSGRVVVVGSINMDLVASVARAPLVGETVSASGMRYVPGGKGSNQALAAARSGVPTNMVASIGTDAFGDELLAYLAETGVDTGLISRSDQAPTGIALVILVEGSDNSIVVVPGANALLGAEHLEPLELTAADVVVCQFEVPLSTAGYALQRARDAGARSVLNPSPATECDTDLLALPDVLIVNETELAWFAGADVDAGDISSVQQAAQQLRGRPDQTILVTLGGAGSLVVQAEQSTLIPARPTRVVDTTGAGDCFAGSLGARLAAGDDIASAVRYATVAASLCCERLGAGTSSPTRDEVLAALADLPVGD